MISNEKFYINDKESYKKFINKKDKEVIVKKVEPVKKENYLNKNAISQFKLIDKKQQEKHDLNIKCKKTSGNFFDNYI